MSDFGPMREAEVSAAARIVALCFASTREECITWLGQAGHDQVRVLRESVDGAPEAPVASLLRIPMGQWWGGRSVPMVGIAAVGVPPEGRGRGTAGRLMAGALREIHDEGVPLSVLYAATQPLYRRVGYEQAGYRFEIRVPVRTFDVRERSMQVREITDADQQQVVACYQKFAGAFNGPLDRGAYIWGRVRKGRGGDFTGFAAIGDGGMIEGYVFLNSVRKADRGRHEVNLSDLAFSTAKAGRRVLSLVSEYASMADDVVLFGGPMHPALFLLGEQRYRFDLRDHWMLRVVNVPRALEARGYHPGLSCSAVLEVRDSVIPENEGRWTVSIEGGIASVKRGSEGPALTVDACGLAALYSGFLSATQLRLLGRAEGNDDAARVWDGVFAGTAASMSDMF